MYKSILLPVDVTEAKESVALITKAGELAKAWGAELHVASIVPDYGMSIVGSYFQGDFAKESIARSHEELDAHIAAAGVEVSKVHMKNGTIYDEVILLAKDLDVDLIVVGAHRPGIRDYLLGSNAARIVRHASQSVFVIRD